MLMALTWIVSDESVKCDKAWKRETAKEPFGLCAGGGDLAISVAKRQTSAGESISSSTESGTRGRTRIHTFGADQ